MNQVLPIVYLARHGENCLEFSGQHTGLTDLALTERGERATRAASRSGCADLSFAKVFTSPLQRAPRGRASWPASGPWPKSTGIWSNGTTASTQGRLHRRDPPGSAPTGELFRDGCSGGESPTEVSARADSTIKRIRAIEGNVLLFPAGTSCVYSPPAGSVLRSRGQADSSC